VTQAQAESVTCLLDGLKEGDGDDIRRLWDRYFRRLVGLAGARLPHAARRAIDPEDVALSAFHSFCARANRGQFRVLGDRDDLWRVLSTIAARKASERIRHESRQKRGGGRVLGESALLDGARLGDAGIDHLPGREPTPAAAAALAEGFERLLTVLGDPALQTIALRRLEGYSVNEIAAAMGVAPRTVDRKLQVIRAVWEREGRE
jgi:DNA-directed RNA polymerase specialized sigma24 family protein